MTIDLGDLVPSDDDLKQRQMLRVVEAYYQELEARMPQLYLDLVKRVNELEKSNQELQDRIFNLERKLRKMP